MRGRVSGAFTHSRKYCPTAELMFSTSSPTTLHYHHTSSRAYRLVRPSSRRYRTTKNNSRSHAEVLQQPSRNFAGPFEVASVHREATTWRQKFTRTTREGAYNKEVLSCTIAGFCSPTSQTRNIHSIQHTSPQRIEP